MAGYSGTPLVTKLGIREGSRVSTLNAPVGFSALLEPLPKSATVFEELVPESEVIVAFFVDIDALASSLDQLIQNLATSGGLWIAWPKKASKVPTNILEQSLRDLILPTTQLVDNKVCAIDETWSGLRFVRRLSSR